MKKKFNQMKVQGKLFSALGLVTLLCAVVLGANMVNVSGIELETRILITQIGKVEDSFHALSNLQRMELAQKRYLLQDLVGARDVHEQYSIELDSYLFRAYLGAQDEGEKELLSATLDAKQAYDDAFARANLEYDQDEASFSQDRLDSLIYEVEENTFSIYDSLEEIVGFYEESAYKSDDISLVYELVSIAISTIALIAFVVLVIRVAKIISDQVYQPVEVVGEATAAFRAGAFDPAALEEIAGRTDEMGRMARAFIGMAQAAQEREESLRGQADELTRRLKEREERQAR